MRGTTGFPVKNQVAIVPKCASLKDTRIKIRPFRSNPMKNLLLLAVCSVSILAALASCKKKGPVEKAGEKMDEAIENVKDAVNPKGPAEKAGEKVDEVLGK